ncbi:hypothetical protein KIN20_027766 [Parelaphostrongylus tenuis]|uniref:Uncharacterized protein n=1 Tax=Parelaphostrongylus tenuis TaxID=148309 RepID=A0AAD5WE65_PARTN|nr:hypothetical protein KIN20_027766 [Parelaphostrongylus tenuis]
MTYEMQRDDINETHKKISSRLLHFLYSRSSRIDLCEDEKKLQRAACEVLQAGKSIHKAHQGFATCKATMIAVRHFSVVATGPRSLMRKPSTGTTRVFSVTTYIYRHLIAN